jgi:predicted nucleic acid-binding protein
LLAARQTSSADYLITGDKDLLALADRYPIVTPAMFWATHAGL